MLRRGVNAGFGDSLTGELAGLRAHGIGHVRQMLRCPDGQGDPAARVAELQDVGLSPCWLVERRWDASVVPAGAWATWQNEPDINGWSPSQYAESFRQVLQDRPDVRWFAGGVSNLTQPALNWLSEFVRLCPEVPGIEVHRYPPKWDPRQPHEGFASRDAEVARLKAIIGSRPYLIGEFGYHLARYRVWWIFWSRHSDQEQADVFRYEWEFWATHGAEAAYAYQVQDGPTDTPIDRYGIRSQYGYWRLSAGTFGPTVPAPDPPAPIPEPDPERSPAPAPVPVPLPPDTAWRLMPDERLAPGDVLYSRSRAYLISNQSSDGNVATYRRRDMLALWATDTVESGSLVMQADGNLVLYADMHPLWATDTSGHPGAYAELRDSGAFVLVFPDGTEYVVGPPDPDPDPPFMGRTGRVRFEGRALADDGGPWCPLGLPLFWAVRGCFDGEHDRVRQNVRWAREQGADFLRVFAETSDWTDVADHDRRTDPRWPSYAVYLRACRDICIDEGMRIAWTVFGGNRLSEVEQSACVDALLPVLNEAPEHVLCVEISNERQGFLDDNGPSRMRMFATRIAAHGHLVTLTSAPHAGDARALYEGSAVSIVNIHTDRTDGERGWRWTRQIYPGAEEFGLGGWPYGTLEPGGPGASVHSDTDPVRVASACLDTFVTGGCLHVVHCGAGIYGVGYTHPVGGYRPADLWEQESLAEAMALVAGWLHDIPQDVANWTRENHGWREHPFSFPFSVEDQKFITVGDLALQRTQGCVRAFATHRDGRYVCFVTGIMNFMDLTPQHAAGGIVTLHERDGRARLLAGEYT